MFKISKSNSLHEKSTKYSQTNLLLRVLLSLKCLAQGPAEVIYALSRCFLTKATLHILRKWQPPEQVAKNTSKVLMRGFSAKKKTKNTMANSAKTVQVLDQIMKEFLKCRLITVQMLLWRQLAGKRSASYGIFFRF